MVIGCFFELFSPFHGFGVFFEHIHVFLGPILCFAERLALWAEGCKETVYLGRQRRFAT